MNHICTNLFVGPKKKLIPLLLCVFALGIMKSRAQISLISPVSLRLLSVSSSNPVSFKFSVTPPGSKTVTKVYSRIGGTIYSAGSPSAGVYTVDWTSSSFGNFPLKGFVEYGDGSTDSTLPLAYKVIKTTLCGAVTYDNSTGYVKDDIVATSTDSVFRRLSYWMVGDYPNISNPNWVYLGLCNSNYYKTFSCAEVAAWSSTTTYSAAGSRVSYLDQVYTNKYYAGASDVPGSSAAWTKEGLCGVYNVLPKVSGVFAKDTTVILRSGLTALTCTLNLSDVDGDITKASFLLNRHSLTPSVSGSNYTLSYTPAAYGVDTLDISATDDENATTAVRTQIAIMPSMPPVVTAVYPLDHAVINTVTSIGTSALTLKATVTDPDNGIRTVTFSIDDGTPVTASTTDSSYSISWIPPAYGAYTLTIKATDSAGAFATNTLKFSLTDPSVESIGFSTMPLQLKMNLGITKVFNMDSSVKSVLARNNSLVKIGVSGNKITLKAYRSGRTGLQITTLSGKVYYVGLRVNNSDGSAAGMPAYASLGFVSEDSPADNGFWEKMDTTLKNKNSDVRYIYINDGPIGDCAGCTTWRDSARHINYCKNSLKYGLTPFFVYYNIPNAGESYETDLGHARDTAYMKAYFRDLSNFVRQCHEVMGDELFGIVLEPDFLGYMQQLGEIHEGTNDPTVMKTCVSETSIADSAGTISSLVQRINKTIRQERIKGANIYFGWQMNLWSDGTTAGTKGIMRTTDGAWDAGRVNVVKGATNVTNYIVKAGVLSNGADFISMDKYGLDAAGYDKSISSSWWFNNDHWDNYLLYAKTVHQISGKNVVLWQLPVGHLNSTTTVSAYTGTRFADLPNTTAKYEDPCTTYFFGDKFTVSDATRKAYFSENNAGDSTMKVLGGDTLQWGEHFSRFQSCGIMHAMFGAGVGISTNGIHDPACDTCGPSDKYYSIQKMQGYYKNNISWVDTTVFTPVVFEYAVSDTALRDLSCKLGNSSSMFLGYNNTAISEAGTFVPASWYPGLHYVSFVKDDGSGAQWKVQRVLIKYGAAASYKVELPAAGTHITTLSVCDTPKGGWIYYRNPADDRYVVAVYPNGNTWNPSSVTLNTDTAAYIGGSGAIALGKRYLSIDAPGSYTAGGGLKLRMYFGTADTAGLLTAPVYRNWYKFEGLGPAAAQAAIDGSKMARTTVPDVAAYGIEDSVHYVEFEHLTSFSTFGFMQSTSTTPLPVKLLEFTATPAGNDQVTVSWKAFSEDDIDHFLVLRNEQEQSAASDMVLDRISAVSGSNSYQLTDRLPIRGKNRYRLQIVDKNGKSEYSSVVLVDMRRTDEAEPELVPNPSSGNARLIVRSPVYGNGVAEIYSLDGKLLKSLPVSNNVTVLDLAALDPGAYLVRYHDDRNVWTGRFIKK